MNTHYLIIDGQIEVVQSDRTFDEICELFQCERMATTEEIEEHLFTQEDSIPENNTTEFEASVIRRLAKETLLEILTERLNELPTDHVDENELRVIIADIYDDSQQESVESFFNGFCDLLEELSVDDLFSTSDKEEFVANFYGLSSFETTTS